MPTVLETARLRLRHFTADDAASLDALDADPDVMRFVGGPAYRLADEAAYRERIVNYFLPYYTAGPAYGFWPAERRDSGEFVGWFHLRPALDYRFAAEAGYQAGELDIGYRLKKSAWGQGLGTEGASELVRRAWADPAVVAIVACALLENVASVRVLEKIGLAKVAEFDLPGIEYRAASFRLPRPDRPNATAFRTAS